MEDDGGSWASRIRVGFGQIIAQGVRQRAERYGRSDEELAQRLTNAFDAAFQCEDNIVRAARDLVHFVDRPNRDEVEMWALEGALRAAPDVYATLIGTMSVEVLRARDEQRDLRLFLWMCDPTFRAGYEKHLRL